MNKIKPRFLFIQPEGENTGIEYLSASLKKNGFSVDLLFIPRPFDNSAFHLFNPNHESNDRRVISRKIDLTKPDIIGFSPFTSQFQWCLKQAEFIKKHYPATFILFGGVHVNSVPREVIKEKYVDAIIVGEADLQIVEFADHFGSEKMYSLDSVWIKKGRKIIKNKLAPLVKNLDSLPFPDKDLFYSQIPPQLLDTAYLIMGSRGCPFACAYCANNVYQRLYLGQNRLRFRSPENIVAELKAARKKYHFRMVEFFDDVLTIDEKRLKPLMQLYRQEVHLPFTCYLHPQLVTEKIIKILKKSDCCWLKLGVQSANEEYRKKYLNRNETNDDIIRVSKLCHKYNLSFSLDHIFNLPGETEKDLVEAVKLYNICRPTIINFGTLIYLPGTDIVNLGVKYKILNQSDVKKINRGINPVYKLGNIDLISYKYKTQSQKINISAFAFLFMMVTTAPPWLVNWLIKVKFYRLRHRVPQAAIILAKIIAKAKAKQLYIYHSVLMSIYYYATFKPPANGENILL